MIQSKRIFFIFFFFICFLILIYLSFLEIQKYNLSANIIHSKPITKQESSNKLENFLKNKKELKIVLKKNKCLNITNEDFIKLIDLNLDSLEIGAYFRPLLTGKNVKYFDVLDKKGLIIKAKIDLVDGSKILDVDYVEPNGNLDIIDKRFNNVFSSHNIEHQTDLIKHLNQVENLLKSNGRYYMMIPDKRYCFDHYVPETWLSDVLDAFFSERKVHTLHKVLTMCETTHNNAKEHWSGNHGNFPNFNLHCYLYQLEKFNEANGSYVDSHNWRFTQESFEVILNNLNNLGLINLEIEKIYCPSVGSNQFMVILKKILN